MLTRIGRRTHINVPQSCWADMGAAFQEFASEMPVPSDDQEEGSGASGSDEN